MKKILFIIIPFILLMVPPPALAYGVVVQNDQTFSTLKTTLPDVLVTEEFGGELSGTTLRIQLHNAILNRTLLAEANLTASPAAALPIVDGLFGSDTIVLKFPTRTNFAEDAYVWLQNVPIRADSDIPIDITADFSATVLNVFVQKEGIVLAHYSPRGEVTTEIKYFTSAGKWWSGAVLINDTSDEKTVKLRFQFNGQELSREVTVQPHSLLVMGFYQGADSERFLTVPPLDGQTGYVRAEIPPGCSFQVLLGDGTQMVSM